MPYTHSLVDTEEAVTAMLDTILALPPGQPASSLFVDLEGANLSRDGTVSLVTIFVQPRDHVYLVDITTLRGRAFDTPAADGSTTLRSVLESPAPTKVFFDVRNDSDALHAHYGVRLRGVEDVQLMENAARPVAAFGSSRQFVRGLAACIQYDIGLGARERTEWAAIKDVGVRLFGPERGGSYAVFDARPLDAEIVRYCANDVRYLPLLRQRYWDRLSRAWRDRVEDETRKRVLESQSAAYVSQGREKAIGPWADQQF